MSKINLIKITADYQAAYLAANKKQIVLTYSKGYFNSLNAYICNWRAAQIVAATVVLTNRVKRESEAFGSPLTTNG
jgi:predicted PP-loop superfamily ATPase